MLITVLGLPTSSSHRAALAIRAIVQVALGDVDFLHFSTLEQLKEQWSLRRSNNVILYTDDPDEKTSQLLASKARQIIFLAEDPIFVALCMQQKFNRQFRASLMLTSSIFASFHDIVVGESNVLILPPEKRFTPNLLIAGVLSFLDIALPDERTEEIVDAIADLDPGGERVEAALDSDTSYAMTAEERIMAQSLIPYRSIFTNGATVRFNWPRQLFLGTDQVGAPTGTSLPEVIELVGPARILSYGPYFHLPRGVWLLRTFLEVEDNYSGNELIIEIMIGQEILVHRPALLPIQGSYSFEVPFTVTEPRYPVEHRLQLRQGAIEGVLILKKVEITRVN